MNAEENKHIKQLLDPDSNDSQQATALKWFADFFEEDYILDLPRSHKSLDALEDYNDLEEAPTKLKKRAQHLHKKYKN